MNIRQLAEQDLQHTLEDAANGFGWNVTLTDTNGNTASLVGQSNDIGLMIDPDTGVQVSGRTATVVLRTSSITSAGMTVPEGTFNLTSRPWIVEFNDISGSANRFKVDYSDIDRTLGTVTMMLGVYA